MPSRLYETLFILDSTKVATDGDAARATVHGVLERYGAEIVVTRPWDENRKLAYPIKKQKKGYYLAVYYRADSLKQADMERDFRITEVLLRHMTSAVDPKWEETFLEMARNDTAPAFAIRGMTDEAAPGDVTPNLAGVEGSMGDDGPPPSARGPRGPRRDFGDKE
ncbi:MAG: 30S ribosomal protein S6 [Fimbriiglobus sp.]